MADRSLPRLPSTLKPAEPEPIIGVVWERVTLELNLALRTAVFSLAALLIAVWAPTGEIAAGAPSFASKPSKGSPETASPAEVQALLNLLADPKVQAWVAGHDQIRLPDGAARGQDRTSKRCGDRIRHAGGVGTRLRAGSLRPDRKPQGEEPC